MSALPAGTWVVRRKADHRKNPTLYRVVGDGCPIYGATCPHGKDAVTVVRQGWTLSECLPAADLVPAGE